MPGTQQCATPETCRRVHRLPLDKNIETPPSERKDIILTDLTAASATDEEFHTALTGPVYDLNADIVHFILTSLAEQHMTRETHQDLWRRTGAGSSSTYVWSIEHILPQGENLPDEWMDILGGAEEAAATQQNYRHHLGNITITGYNSSLSNVGFIKKRDRTDQKGNPIGYRNRLSLNHDLAGREEWGATEIVNRTEALVEQTMRAFPWDTRSLIQERLRKSNTAAVNVSLSTGARRGDRE